MGKRTIMVVMLIVGSALVTMSLALPLIIDEHLVAACGLVVGIFLLILSGVWLGTRMLKHLRRYQQRRADFERDTKVRLNRLAQDLNQQVDHAKYSQLVYRIGSLDNKLEDSNRVMTHLADKIERNK